MPKPTVYIETTVFSYYFDDRDNVTDNADRTRQWWDTERHLYACVTSDAVTEELTDGVYPWQQDAIKLTAGISRLTITPEVDAIASAYWNHRAMPAFPVRDALHVAAATFHGINFLLTWNCLHLANANKARHLEVLNRRLGYNSPRIVTPHLLRPLEDWL